MGFCGGYNYGLFKHRVLDMGSIETLNPKP